VEGELTRCKGCGCTQARACDDGGVGCHWREPNLCSVCARRLEEAAGALLRIPIHVGQRIVEHGISREALSEAFMQAGSIGGSLLLEGVAIMFAVGGAPALRAWSTAHAIALCCHHAGSIYALIGRFDKAIEDAATFEDAAARVSQEFRWELS
jgi:hypothetical protein